jgi:hypothetical protein
MGPLLFFFPEEEDDDDAPVVDVVVVVVTVRVVPAGDVSETVTVSTRVGMLLQKK